MKIQASVRKSAPACLYCRADSRNWWCINTRLILRWTSSCCFCRRLPLLSGGALLRRGRCHNSLDGADRKTASVSWSRITALWG